MLLIYQNVSDVTSTGMKLLIRKSMMKVVEANCSSSLKCNVRFAMRSKKNGKIVSAEFLL